MNLKKIFSSLLMMASALSFVACGGGSGDGDGDAGKSYPNSLAGCTMSFDANNVFMFSAAEQVTGTRNGKACAGTYEYREGSLTMRYELVFADGSAPVKLECAGKISGYVAATGTGTYACVETNAETHLPTGDVFPNSFTLSSK
ncbi:MAG: hypothetical protein IKW49_06180 [Opitutales bacterium]|nr:hypothetical protein [Opitutales bacterium]